MKSLSDLASKLEGQKMFQIKALSEELERQGKDIIHFEIGDPDFDTPENVRRAAIQSLNDGETHYANSKGLLELRVAATDVTKRSRGFKPDLEQVLVTPGANYQIRLALGCIVNPKEEVIIPDPLFVSYNSLIHAMDAKAVKIPLKEENKFRLNPKDVEKAISDKTRMIVINSPNNPTGAVMTSKEIEEVYNIAREADVYLLSDEVYARAVFKNDGIETCSPSKFDYCKERVIVVNGFSKSFAMTGWRLGVATGPSELIGKMNLLLESELSCVAPFVQKAGVEALRGNQDETFEMRGEYQKRRDIVVDGLNNLPGISCIKPQGAFYAFPNIRETGFSSEDFAKFMLDDAGVALCPGNYFGDNGEGYVRLCYANSIENIQRGIGRMKESLRRKSSGKYLNQDI